MAACEEAPTEYRASATVSWTKEAEAFLTRIPEMARPVAIQGINNHCIAEGHTVVTSSVLEAAIRQILPPEAIARMGIEFGHGNGIEAGSLDKIALSFTCDKCGHLHRGNRPQVCPVCGREGASFKLSESSDVAAGETRTALGDREVVWESECLTALEAIDNEVLREQLRNKLEKQALRQRLSAITVAMLTEALPDAGEPIWTDAAAVRLERVPQGFMREAARRTITEHAESIAVAEISLEVAEDGLAKAREKMKSAMGGAPQTAPQDAAQPEEQAEMPWDADALNQLSQVPEGFMRKMTRARVEHWARANGHARVTREVMEAKYQSWAEGSEGHEPELPWTDAAAARVGRVPAFIRPMVMRELERGVQARGLKLVDEDAFSGLLDNWADDATSFHG